MVDNVDFDFGFACRKKISLYGVQNNLSKQLYLLYVIRYPFWIGLTTDTVAYRWNYTKCYSDAPNFLAINMTNDQLSHANQTFYFALNSNRFWSPISSASNFMAEGSICRKGFFLKQLHLLLLLIQFTQIYR